MTEITITIRPSGTLSIQAAGIGRGHENMDEAKQLLRRALTAMGKEPDETRTNEIIFYAK